MLIYYVRIKKNIMKKILPTFLLLSLVGCCQTKTNPLETVNDTLTTIPVTTIQEIVDWANSQEYTKQEAEHWDSLSELYAYPVRDAERELDTIVNHLRIHFYKHE